MSGSSSTALVSSESNPQDCGGPLSLLLRSIVREDGQTPLCTAGEIIRLDGVSYRVVTTPDLHGSQIADAIALSNMLTPNELSAFAVLGAFASKSKLVMEYEIPMNSEEGECVRRYT
jgi:hypothetical protein